MAPPPMTTGLQLSSAVEPFSRPTSPVFPTITPHPGMNSSDDQGKNDDEALAITTVKDSVTCGWYAGAVSQAFICSEPLTCATNTDSIIACSSKNEKIEFYSICLNVYNGSPRDCAIEGVLCCNSVYPSCMTLVWTASPTRSLVQCAAMESTWSMQNYPFVLGQTTTSSTSDTPTSSSFSPKITPPSGTSQPSTSSMSLGHSTSNKVSSNSPGISSTSSSNNNTVALSPGSGFSTFPATTSAPSNAASNLPVEQTPSRGLSTGAKAGISVVAGAGMLIILALIGLFIFKKCKHRVTTQFDEFLHQNNNTPGSAGLQENPNGDLPAAIAPPARGNRSLASGWAVGASSNDDYDLMEGASEVPVDMRGQGVGAVELAGSPVEMSTLDSVSQSQYKEYETQASQYQRYSQMSRDAWGPMPSQGLSHEHESWTASST